MRTTNGTRDRSLADLVGALERLLADCDQVADTPQRPNLVTVWGVREVLEDFGGTPHRWHHPRCPGCGHTVGFHHPAPSGCTLCPCALTGTDQTPRPR